MSANAARDLRYGRRAGRWASQGAGQLLAELRLLRNRMKASGRWPETVDLTRLFHPDTIGRSRAHDRDCKVSRHRKDQPCTAVADPADVAALWDGRAHMARARQAAGQPLTVIDLQALRQARRRSEP